MGREEGGERREERRERGREGKSEGVRKGRTVWHKLQNSKRILFVNISSPYGTYCAVLYIDVFTITYVHVHTYAL